MRPRDDGRLIEQLRAMGLDEDEIRESQEGEAVAVWPDAVDPLMLFSSLITQWRMGPGGPTGIDHTRRDVEARRLFKKKRRRRRACELLAVMESEALRIITEQARAALEH